MKYFYEIESSYKLIDLYLANQINMASRKKDKKEERKWTRIRDINEAAHFVLIFAQIEEGIDRKWKSMPPLSKPNVYFMDKVKALTKDLTQQRLIGDYYSKRCDIAHGSMVYANFALPQAIVDLRTVASKIL